MKSFSEFLSEAEKVIQITFSKGEVDINRYPDEDTTVILIRAIIDNKVVAWAEYYKDWGTVEQIQVDPKWRRKGIATKIYDAIEKKYNTKLTPSDILEPDGLKFWKNRDPYNDKLRFK